jgi:hypothetical protein
MNEMYGRRPGRTGRFWSALIPTRPSRRLAALVILAGLAWLSLPALPPVAAGDQLPSERRVFTYFYYWYEPWRADDPHVVLNHEMLTNHFPLEKPADWRSVYWFMQQFRDMQLAGIDDALAVYWGDGLYETTGWSTAGLAPMVAALDTLDAAGEPHPKVGLFFDTYVLQGAALAEPERRAWFVEQIRAYFQRMPERHRATRDGRPIIWLYYSNFANSFDQQTFDQIGQELEAELGARPFWVAEVSWRWTTTTDLLGQRHFNPRKPMQWDALYRWGAASRGTLYVDKPIPLASVGPGYDDTALHDRGDERSSRPRETGCFYARNWQKAQLFDAHWVVVETWNELYEGSGVAESREWKREYIEASARYSRQFKSNTRITLPTWCGVLLEDEDDDAVMLIEDPPPLGPDESNAADRVGASAEAGAEAGSDSAESEAAAAPDDDCPPNPRMQASNRDAHRCALSDDDDQPGR